MTRISFFLLVLISVLGKSQNNLQLSYDSFLLNVLQNNPLAKRAENEKKYADVQYKAARGNYDPILSGNYEQKQFNGRNYFTT